MNKSKKPSKKEKKNQTKRRRKIRGGRFKAILAVYPVYELDDDGVPTNTIKRFDDFGSLENDMTVLERIQKIDQMIDLTMNDGKSLVPKGVIPVVHHLTGKHPNKAAAPATTGTTGTPTTTKPTTVEAAAAALNKAPTGTGAAAAPPPTRQSIEDKIKILYPDDKIKAKLITDDFPDLIKKGVLTKSHHYPKAKILLLELLLKSENKQYLEILMAMANVRRK